ncbi:MAG: type II secretion system protein [Sulfuricurvum sp.]|nr:type II secretion system protein [Sulfuricurvum sp.]
MKRTAFTMIELIFVIVVLGILSAIAIPKFAATRDDAQIAKGRSDVAAIRSAIVSERQGRLLRGDSAYINKLHNNTATLFDNNGTATSTILQYGIVTQANTNGHWQNSADQNGTSWVYKYRVLGSDNSFTYNPTNGTFTCTNGTSCGLLVN